MYWPLACVAREVDLSADDWQRIVECLDTKGFWAEKSHKVTLGLDGNNPVLEAAIAGRYNAVMHGGFSVAPTPASFSCFEVIERLSAPLRQAVLSEHDGGWGAPRCR